MLDVLKHFVKWCEVVDDRTIRIRVESPWLTANLILEIEKSSRLARALLLDICEGAQIRGTTRK